MLRGKNQITGGTSGNAKLIGCKDPPTRRVPLPGSPHATIGAMHSPGELSQTGMHRHPAAVSRRPVSLLPAPTDFARPILALCSGVRRNSNGVVTLRPAAIRTGEVLAARFRFAFLVPVGDRVGWNLVELHAGLESAILGLWATALATRDVARVYAVTPDSGRCVPAASRFAAAATGMRRTHRPGSQCSA
jgi:hypothetical protein